ncbi:MAG TPA: hypothetical protein VIT62_10000 [Lysobacter sp.]
MTTFDDLVRTFALRRVTQGSGVRVVTKAADPAPSAPTLLPTFRGSAADWLLAQLGDGELHKVIRLLDEARDSGIARGHLMQAKDVALRGRIVEGIRIDPIDGSMAAAWTLRRGLARSRRRL